MPIGKPVALPRWATAPVLTPDEPSEGKKDDGWVVEKPPAEWLNWLFKLLYDWTRFVDDPDHLKATANASTPAIYGINLGQGSALRGDTASDDVTTAGAKGISTGAAPGGRFEAGTGDALIAVGNATLGSAVGTAASALSLIQGASIPTGKALALAGTAKITLASNPASNVAILNEIHAKSVAKAWAHVTINHTLGPNVDAGINVSNVIVGYVGGDNTKVTVFFAQAMDVSIPYAVTFGPRLVTLLSGDSILIPYVVAQDNAKFTFKVMAVLISTGAVNTAVNFSTDNGLVDFNINGQQ